MTPLRCADGASAARSFVQLAKRRYSTANTHVQQTPLEFLVPRKASHFGRRTSILPASRSSVLSIGRQTASRPFSASTSRLATICVQNPQKDEDGKDMVLEITSRAAQVWLLLQHWAFILSASTVLLTIHAPSASPRSWSKTRTRT